ncbi:MAG: hypothetical protein ACLFUR_02155 [Candidatus Hadarchaeia archaeon]
MSTVLKIFAGLILASLFIGIFVHVNKKLEREHEVSNFKEKSKEIITNINYISDQSPGERRYFSLEVPPSCALILEENQGKVKTANESVYQLNMETENLILLPGSYQIAVEAKEKGVYVKIE